MAIERAKARERETVKNRYRKTGRQRERNRAKDRLTQQILLYLESTFSYMHKRLVYSVMNNVQKTIHMNK